MEPRQPTITAQIAKYPKLGNFGLSQAAEKCNNGDLNIRYPNMTQGFEQTNFNRYGYHLGNIVNEKRDKGLFEAIFGFCHTVNGWSNILYTITFYS